MTIITNENIYKIALTEVPSFIKCYTNHTCPSNNKCGIGYYGNLCQQCDTNNNYGRATNTGNNIYGCAKCSIRSKQLTSLITILFFSIISLSD